MDRENRFLLPIRVDYQSPRILQLFLLVIHSGAIFCVLSSALSATLQFFLISLICLINLKHYQQYCLEKRLENRPKLILDKDNNWRIILSRVGEVSCRLLPGAFVHRLLVVLRFIDESGRRHTFIFCPDNINNDEFRRLRVRFDT